MRAKEKERENKIFQILAWALLGAVLTYIVCAVSLTGGHAINAPFYNCGEVDEISITSFRRDIEQEGGHQEASGTVVLDQGYFSYTLSVGRHSDGWNYLCVQIDDLTTDNLNCQVTYRDIADGEVRESVAETYTLTEGMNPLALPEQKFTQMGISFSGETGCSFSIGAVQLRENPPVSGTAKAVVIIMVTIFCYIFLSGMIWYFYRGSDQRGRFRPYVCIEILQEMYLVIFRWLVGVREKLPGLYRYRRFLRTALFLFFFCFCAGVHVAGNFYVRYPYYIAIYILVLAAIGFFSIKREPEKKNWNNALVWGWLLTGVLMCVSDFAVQKVYYRFSGYAILLGIGFFIFIWNNMGNYGEILSDLARSCQVFLWIITVYCVLFRPDNGVTRYNGFAGNPNRFSIYLIVCWAFVFGALEHGIRTHTKEKKLLFYIIEACVIFSFVWKTQSITAIVAIALVALIWLVRMCCYTSKHKLKKRLICVLVAAGALLLPVHGVLSLGLQYVPEKLGTEIVYEDDAYIEKTFLGTEVYAAEADNWLQSSRLMQKLMASNSAAEFFSERTYIWKEYVRDLNLLGHEDRPLMYVADFRHFSHNGVLGMAYYYGIFTAIPYVVMLAAAFMRMWRFSRRRITYAAVPLFICISFLVETSVECVEQPFDVLLWLVMYILMGSVFCDAGHAKPAPSKKRVDFKDSLNIAKQG